MSSSVRSLLRLSPVASNNLQILASGQRLLDRLTREGRRKAAVLFAAVIADTPVDTGLLRHNWKVGIGRPDLTMDIGYGDPTEKVIRQVLNATKATKIYLSNIVPYGKYIEMGHSSQSPAGMVRLNLQRFRSL